MAGVAKEGFNMYYPPEWRPEHGDLDKFHGGHKLGNQEMLFTSIFKKINHVQKYKETL